MEKKILIKKTEYKNGNEHFEISNKNLLYLLPKNQMDEVFKQEWCDIEPCFLGFVDIYERLSEVIPLHFTIIDLGCVWDVHIIHSVSFL